MPYSIDEATAGRLERVAPRALRLFGLSTSQSGLESTGPVLGSATAYRGPPDDRDEKAIARELAAAMSDGPRPEVAGWSPDEAAVGMATHLVRQANETLQQLSEGQSVGSLSTEQVLALESVIRTRGRPALKVEHDRIEAVDEVRHPESEIWRVLLNAHEASVVSAACATGAVKVLDQLNSSQRWIQGTAWLAKPGLVVTNRHVLFPPAGGMRLARRIAGKPTEARIRSDLRVTIDFAFDSGPVRRLEFLVTGAPFVSADSDPVDVALLQIEATNQNGPEPGHLRLAGAQVDIDAMDQLYVIGHPGRIASAVPSEVQTVFGTPDERKRVSFGEQMNPDPSRPLEILHDASTIGGYSGGCVLGFASACVMALHYFGDPATGNRAFTARALRSHDIGSLIDS